MITEPTTGWAKNALQDFETLYIGGAEPADVRRGPGLIGTSDRTRITAIAKEAKRPRWLVIVLGSGQWNKHEVER